MKFGLKNCGIAALALVASISGMPVMADTIVHILRAEVPNNEKAIYNEAIGEFEKAHPGDKVQISYLANEAYKQKLTTLLQSNNKPDIIFSWAGGVLSEQVQSGVLQDITPKLNGPWAASFSPASVGAFTVDGKVYGVPLGTSEVVFWVNKTLAAKAGIDYKGIKTWQDFLAAVKKAKAAGVTPIMVGGKDKWPLHFYYSYLMLREAGKAGMQSAFKGEGKGFAAPAFVKAGEEFKQLIDLNPFEPGFMSLTFEQASGQFGDGKAVFHLMGDWDYGTQKANSISGKGIADENLDTIRFPVVTGGAGQYTDTFGGVTGWAVVKDAKPQAVEFLKVLSSLKYQQEGAAGGSFIPIVKGADTALTKPFFKSMAKDVSASTYHQNFLNEALGANAGEVFNDAAADLAQGVTSPQKAAESIQNAWSMR
ncbi:raffinose/stachyose/melibiose transport system substrate-binding protein [Paraburkholderia steynii]|uniref:Raffinose/stachyose/melibiose transport system substrate-binding protein n=1 Tax=Paraburkholderia steynii TaxID=1245441 RepID=A0A7Z7BBE5_9BURK|nr:extracellular solute-binding protein [Paraburkholderia steynii]SDI56338.1 raffinose/stachyose/melibiose transport system substrate-binding protein [Paraburkholderia steynii]